MLEKIGGWVSSVGSMEVNFVTLFCQQKLNFLLCLLCSPRSIHTLRCQQKHNFFVSFLCSSRSIQTLFLSGPDWKQGRGDPDILDSRGDRLLIYLYLRSIGDTVWQNSVNTISGWRTIYFGDIKRQTVFLLVAPFVTIGWAQPSGSDPEINVWFWNANE